MASPRRSDKSRAKRTSVSSRSSSTHNLSDSEQQHAPPMDAAADDRQRLMALLGSYPAQTQVQVRARTQSYGQLQSQRQTSSEPATPAAPVSSPLRTSYATPVILAAPASAIESTSMSASLSASVSASAEGSSGSLYSHHQAIEFSSPSPPSSANVSTSSSGRLPENVHLSMPGMARPAFDAPQPVKSASAGQSRAELRRTTQMPPLPRPLPSIEGAKSAGSSPASDSSYRSRNSDNRSSSSNRDTGDRQRRKITAPHSSQFAQSPDNPTQQQQQQTRVTSSSGSSPAASTMSPESRHSVSSSPHSVTVDDMQRASRMQPRRAVAAAAAAAAGAGAGEVASDDADNESGSSGARLSQSTHDESRRGKWSEATTPSPGKDRDSGLFGNQPFSFTSPANASSGIATPRPPGGFEPIAEIDEDAGGGSWSQAVARSQGVTALRIDRNNNNNNDNNSDESNEHNYDHDHDGVSPAVSRPGSAASAGARSRPKYDVRVPPPETLARTPTLITRSPTPTRMLDQQQLLRPRTPSHLSTSSSPGPSRRRRATTVSHGDDSVTHGGDPRSRRSSSSNPNNAGSSSYNSHSRSRSFGSSTEHITLQQIQSQRIRLEQLQLQQGQPEEQKVRSADDLKVPLIPPPPEGGALQFLNPFVGRSSIGSSSGAGAMHHGLAHTGDERAEGVPEYLYERVSPQYHPPESATRTRMRHRKQRNPSSVVSSAASPAYTLSSAYSPSNAGSNTTYELTFLGMHRTVDSAYQPSIGSRNNSSQVMSESSVGAGLAQAAADATTAIGALDQPRQQSARAETAAEPPTISRSDSRRRSASVASSRPSQSGFLASVLSDANSSPVPTTPGELRSARRRQMHVRSESSGSSRVSSIREEFEQRQQQAAQELIDDVSSAGSARPKSAMSSHRGDLQRPTTPGSKKATPVLERWELARREVASRSQSGKAQSSSASSTSSGVVAAPAVPSSAAAHVPLTPKSRKVAQIRERIEEWQQRSEASGDPASMGAMPPIPIGSSSSGLDMSSGGSSAHASDHSPATMPTMGAQKNIGVIETVHVSSAASPSRATVSPATSANASEMSQPRLVPLTPALGYHARQDTGSPAYRRPVSSQLGRVQALERSNTQASRDSKYSNDTTQSSNAPPSLFGSDKSVFNTPLLTGLPPLSVPSDISSLRTQNTATTSRSAHRQPIPSQSPEPTQQPVHHLGQQGLETVDEQAPEEREASLRDSVLSAVSSPVSVGGHKKQSMIIDARSASTEILQDLQQVKASSPRLVQSQTHSSASSATGSSSSCSSRLSGGSGSSSAARRVTTTEVMQSPEVSAPPTLSAVERRAWAASRPTERPPISGVSEDSMSEGQSRRWEEKMRRRATASRMMDDRDLAARPEMADSPAHAREPKNSGGLVSVAMRDTGAVGSSGTSPAIGSGTSPAISSRVSPSNASDKRSHSLSPSQLPLVRNVVADMPAAGGADSATSIGTQPVTEEFRKERVFSALASLEGTKPMQQQPEMRERSPRSRKARHNRDPIRSGPSSPTAPAVQPNMQSKFSLTDSSSSSSSRSNGGSRHTSMATSSEHQPVVSPLDSDVPVAGSSRAGTSPSSAYLIEQQSLHMVEMPAQGSEHLLSAIATPVAASIPRPPSQRMGRHGSSPLNPYNGPPISPAPGSPAPPLPPIPAAAASQGQPDESFRQEQRQQPQQQQQQEQQPPGLIKRITGTIRRKYGPSEQQQQQPPQQQVSKAATQPSGTANPQVAFYAQTPLPRRWWRNIKESMYAPIPPLHSNIQEPPLAAQLAAPQPAAGIAAPVDQLPARPARRHSFSGSTDIEQGRIAAALSPRENVRRKNTLGARVREMLRGRRGALAQSLFGGPSDTQQAPAVAAATTAAAAGVAAAAAGASQAPSHKTGSSGPPGAPLTERLDLHIANTVSSMPGSEHINGNINSNAEVNLMWAPTNPFNQQAAAPGGIRRRASFDTLSVHEMAEVDRLNMHSRLHQLLSPHMAMADSRPGTNQGAMVSASHLSLANSPQLGVSHATASPVYTPSSKFSFTVPVPLPGIPGQQTPAGGRTPKPLPATPPPRRQSHMAVGNGGSSSMGSDDVIGNEQSVFKFPPRQEMVEKPHKVVSPSPIFKDSDQASVPSSVSRPSSGKGKGKGKRASTPRPPAMLASASGDASGAQASRQEMVQRPNAQNTSYVQSTGNVAASAPANVQFAATNTPILVNAAQITTASQPIIPPIMSEQAISPVQQQQQQQQQQGALQQLPYTMPAESGNDGGLYKRPSLLQRLTSGWRKPAAVPCPPPQAQPGRLEPIAEQQTMDAHTNPLKAVAGIAGISAAAGMLGKLFQPSTTSAAAAATSKDEYNQVPAVNVVQSPEHGMYAGQTGQAGQAGQAGQTGPSQAFQGYPNNASNYVAGPQPYGTGQPGYQASMVAPVAGSIAPMAGSAVPMAPPHGTQIPGFPNTVNSTSAHLPYSQTPMPGQTHFQSLGQSTMQQPVYAGPGGQYSGPPLTHSGESQYPPMHPQMQTQPGAGPSGPNKLSGPIEGGQSSGLSAPSKIMAAMASIPILGSLFSKKSSPPAGVQPPPAGGFNPVPAGGFNQSQPTAPLRYDSVPHGAGHPPGTYASSLGSSRPNAQHKPPGSSIHPGSAGHKEDNGGLGSLLSKAMDKLHWVQIPILSYALRESFKHGLKPLVGRYALQYPLIEAEESAAIRAAAAKVEQNNVVRAGALRALDAKEFRHAARGLRNSSLDQRLENIYVPRFSRLRKYRRAPEVWDDEDAHNIARRVYSRLNTVQSMRGREQARLNRALSITSAGRRPGEPRLRGGGRVTKNRGYLREMERGGGDRLRFVEGHPGSGERAIADDGATERTLRGGGPGPGGDLLANRIGAYFAGLRGGARRQDQPAGSQQGPASFAVSPTRRGLRHQQQNMPGSRVSPGTEGLSRIIDDDDMDDDFVRIHVSVSQGSRRCPPDNASDHGSELISIHRVSTEEDRQNQERSRDAMRRDVILDHADDHQEDARPADGAAGRVGLRQRLFGAFRGQQQQQQQKQQQQQELDEKDREKEYVLNTAAEQPPPPTPVQTANAAPVQTATAPPAADPTKSPHYPPMFPPFSHLPPRVVEYIMHRVGEPRVFIGSAASQLVPPNNGAFAGDGAFGDSSPYRTGTEWNFVESVKFSSPYPTAAAQVQSKSVWARINSNGPGATKTTRRLLVKSRSNEIARWPAHIEIVRDYIQMLALVLGACGFTKSPVDSTVGQRWPWMVVGGIPETLGLLWADLSTTTGKSTGFLVFFGAVAAAVLGMWSYGLYLERPPPVAPGSSADDKELRQQRQQKEGSEPAEDRKEMTYQEELAVEPSPFNLFGRLFGRMPKRQRMHILYFVLTTLYIPMIKLCVEAIVWSQGYWPVPNPFRETDRPEYPAAADDQHRDPSRFCYTTTMRNGRFNGAFVMLPLAVLLLLALGLGLPMQVYQLSRAHMPRVPGWLDGKTPGYRLPPADQVGPSRPTSALAAAAAPAAAAATEAGTTRRAASIRTRDDPNPMLSANALLQGIDKLGIMNPEVFGNLALLYNLVNNGGAGGYGAGKYGSGTEIAGMVTGMWGQMQKWFSGGGGNGNGSVSDDPYLGMSKDEAYQARLRDMKVSHRNRHLATVQYRRALDTDTSDYRFLYVAHYPHHAADAARLLLWKLLAVVVAVVFAKDNCWLKARSRSSLDAGRNVALLLLALLMLRSHHSHRPYFDPTANLASLAMRVGVLVAVVFAFPLFLLRDPLSSTHTGLCVTLALVNLALLLALLWLASSALPKFQMVIRGTAQPLTLSPGILVATSPYDPRLRRLLIERVWQDTWSAILLASRDFRLLPNHRIAFCRTRAHPPYMVNYIGFAAERHLENLHLYDAIGRRAYCQAVNIERANDQRMALMDDVARGFTGPDMYFNPYAGSDSAALNFYGVGRNDVRSWFGKTYILHFPFMVCMVYDELPDVVVPIADEQFLRLYLQQNRDDPAVLARRDVRRRLRALDGQHVTLTYIENAGPGGSHQRYCLPEFAEDNDAYLAQFTGRRRILYRGTVLVRQHARQQVASGVNVSPGFDCALSLTDELVVDDEYLVNNLSRAHNAFRMAFWQTGRAPDSLMLVRTDVSPQSRRILGLTDHNRHILGVTPTFDMTPELRALFEENSETIDARLAPLNAALAQHMKECHAGFLRKRTGLTPSFHIDVFAPGPESHHVQQMVQQAAATNMPPPMLPATPALFGGNPALNGQWHEDEHGRLSCIPTMEQLADRLERFEENKYMRDLLIDHRDDITLLYERLRTLVPSESNDPVKFAWYIFWDDLYRRYGKSAKQGGVKELRQYDVDFNPLYPQALPYYPLPRHRLELFLYERGLWKPLKTNKPGGLAKWLGLPWFGRRQQGGNRHALDEYDMDPMPVPEYLPGIHGPADGAAVEARLWRAGDGYEDLSDLPFEPGTPATGFLHSGLLNRLYAWLDVIAFGTDR